MRRFFIFGLALLFSMPLSAQVEKDDDFQKMKQESQSMFEQFRQQAVAEYEDFRQQANAEYARFMEEAWTPYSVMDAEEVPMQPKPVTITFEHEARVTNSMIEYDVIDDTPLEHMPDFRLPLGSTSNEGLELEGQPMPLDPIMDAFDANSSCLENPRDGGAWWAAVYGVVQSRTQLKQLSSRGIKEMENSEQVSP